MVTNEERWLVQKRLKEIEEGESSWLIDKRKKSFIQKIENWFYRKYYSLIYPIWRKLKDWDQIRVHGFNRSDTWDFYQAHATWVLPRLKCLRDNFCGMPMRNPEETEDGRDHYTKEEWKVILHKMCRAFWLIKKSEDDFLIENDPLTKELIEEGLELFRKHYLSLWD